MYFKERNTRGHIWILLVLGSMVTLLGFLTLAVHHPGVGFRFRLAQVIESVIFIFLGISLLLFAFNKKALPTVLGALVLGLEGWRILTIAPIVKEGMVSEAGQKYLEAFLPYVWVNLLIVFVAALSLILVARMDGSKVLGWLGGISAGIALAFTIITLGAYLVNLELIRFWGALITVTFIDCLAMMCFCVGLIFHITYHLPFQYATWFSVVVGIACLGGAFSSWGAFDAREKYVLFQDEKERAKILELDVLRESGLYFSALERYAKRVLQSEASYELAKVDAESYVTDYTFLETILITEEDEKTVLRVGYGTPLPVGPSMELELAGLLKNSFFPDEKLLVSTVSLSTSKKHVYFVTNFPLFLHSVIRKHVGEGYSFEIFYDSESLVKLGNASAKYKDTYGINYHWSFLGLPLNVEFWPATIGGFTFQSIAGLYHLIIGIIFSFAIALCVYFIQQVNKQRKEAENANLEKNFFIANISHELRTPLHGIVGALSILDTMEMGQEQRRWFDGLRRESWALHDLISELIDLSNMELGSGKLNLRPVDLRRLGQEIYERYEKSAKEKGLKLTYLYSNALPTIFMTDGLRMRQIMTNLVVNAIQFTENGAVTIAIEGQKEAKNHFTVSIRVTDTGVGIEKSQRAIIFEKFKHIDVRDTKRSGLGLGITERLVRSMQGWIQLESVVGKGSEFTVHLKLEAVEQAVDGADAQTDM